MGKDDASQQDLQKAYEDRGMDSKDASKAAEHDSKIDSDQFKK